MDESHSDLADTVSWFKRVTPSMVEAFQIAGWVVEPVAPSHHDAHCVLMRFAGKGDPENAPRMPVGSRVWCGRAIRLPCGDGASSHAEVHGC